MARLESRGVRPGPIPACAGIGLRAVHHQDLLHERPAVGWIEAHTENYFHEGGAAVRALERARADYPLSLHGVGLGLGSVDGVDREHLARVRHAIARFEPALVSEHACWGHSGGEFFNDLLPLPYTDEAVELLARQVGEAQDALGTRLLIENVSAYVAFEHSRLHEWEFLTAVADLSGCGLLLDVNNVYVNGRNHGIDPISYLNTLPQNSVAYYHVAGHLDLPEQDRILDTHGTPVANEVMELGAYAIQRFGDRPIVLERDSHVPLLDELCGELNLVHHAMTRRVEAAA